MKQENCTYDIYYDREGDFLEITFDLPPEKTCAEEIEPGVFVSKNEKTEEIYGIGILGFSKRVELLKKILNRIKISFPLDINFASLDN